MNQTMETILTRRSIRSFQVKPIPEEDLKQIQEKQSAAEEHKKEAV